jgi:hypothetical protein
VSALADEAAMEELIAQIRGMKVADFLLSNAVTLASIAFGKLDAGELDEARLGIDALAALVPLIAGDARRDLAQTLANLQLTYANAVTAAADRTTE